MFIGTKDACNINVNVPVVTDDDQEEGADYGTLPPASALATETSTANDTGDFGKGTKGKKGFGKRDSGKAEKKGKKGADFGIAPY